MFAFPGTLAVSLSPSSGATLWVLGVPASSAYAPVQTIWQHWAVVRSGTTVTLYIAGVPLVSQVVSASASLSASSFVIGGSGTADGTAPPFGNLPGLVSEFRVVLNSALYTGPFAPPTQPFDAIQGTVLLLHAVSPSQLLTDSSSAAAVASASSTAVSWNSAAPFSCYPSGSLSFAGSLLRVRVGGACVQWSLRLPRTRASFLPAHLLYSLQAPPSAAPLERSDWTIEWWASPQSLANSRIFSFGVCCGTQVLLAVELQPAGTPAVTLLGVNIFAAWPPLYGSWVHMALVRNGTLVTWYVQGNPMTIGTVPATTNFSASAASPLMIGGDSTFRAYSGLLSNFKIVAGTALYPVSFPVLRPPLPAVSGTLVLLRAATPGAALADSSGRGVVVSATGVSWNASAPAGTGGSLSFAGSTASIIALPSACASLGTVRALASCDHTARADGSLPRVFLQADFTVEFWVLSSAGSSEYRDRLSEEPHCALLSVVVARAAVRPFSIGSLLSIELRSAGFSLLIFPSSSATSSYTAVWGVWQLMAIVRLGVRLYWFVQGAFVAVAGISASTNFSASDAAPMFIGGDNTTARGGSRLSRDRRVC